jgi:hypothetical protein
MRAIAEELRGAVDEALPRLRALDEAASARAPAPGKWSPRELLGHLIDSASNNHQRFVRARFQDDLVFPGYDQDAWVSAQGYRTAPWHELVELWQLFNLHLARVFESTPRELARRAVTRHSFDRIAFGPIPAGQPTTLAYFAGDYVAHLRHHLRALGAA